MSCEAVRGYEFDWFAVDGEGHVGHFASAGFGPVPLAVLDGLDRLRGLDEQLFRGLRNPPMPELIALRGISWDDMVWLGLYSYDWQHWGGPYHRVGAPRQPLRVTDMPEDLGLLVRAVEWPSVRFAVSASLRPESLRPRKHKGSF